MDNLRYRFHAKFFSEGGAKTLQQVLVSWQIGMQRKKDDDRFGLFNGSAFLSETDAKKKNHKENFKPDFQHTIFVSVDNTPYRYHPYNQG